MSERVQPSVNRTKKTQLICDQCSYTTDRKNNLDRHVGKMHESLAQPKICCDIEFRTAADLDKHKKDIHPNNKYSCPNSSCSHLFFPRPALLQRHIQGVHAQNKKHS